jgi:hypothetical protein
MSGRLCFPLNAAESERRCCSLQMYEVNHIPGAKIVNEGTFIVNHANNAAMIINNTMPMFSIIADGLLAAMRSCTMTATHDATP